MPRPFMDYSQREWWRIRPLIDRYKHARYRLYADYLIRSTAPPSSIEPIRDRIRGNNLIVSIAFNDPERIEQQARLVRRFVNGAVYLVVDNSNNPTLARHIEERATQQDILYFRPPLSPWSESDFSRDHGFAMTWIWRHVIRPARPNCFGFIDHDIYPLKPTDPFAPLGSYPVAGRVIVAGPVGHRERMDHWYLWAGFCFFRYDAVRQISLNFGLDPLAGFDTGFLNWHCLYRYLDRSQVPEPPFSVQAIVPDVPVEQCAVERIGDWLHEGRFRNPESYAVKQRWVRELLAPLLGSQANDTSEQVIIRDLVASEAQRIVNHMELEKRRVLARAANRT